MLINISILQLLVTFQQVNFNSFKPNHELSLSPIAHLKLVQDRVTLVLEMSGVHATLHVLEDATVLAVSDGFVDFVEDHLNVLEGPQQSGVLLRAD